MKDPTRILMEIKADTGYLRGRVDALCQADTRIDHRIDTQDARIQSVESALAQHNIPHPVAPVSFDLSRLQKIMIAVTVAVGTGLSVLAAVL